MNKVYINQASRKLFRVGIKTKFKKMTKSIFSIAFTLLCVLGLHAQTKKDGTPDMRYNSNKQTYGNSYSAPSYSAPSYSTPSRTNSNYSTPTYSAPKPERNYDNGGQYKVQDGYMKSNGTYVAPHIKTTPDNNTYNNYKPRR